MSELESFLRWALNDPLVELLLARSFLTKTQFEVLLIDTYSKRMGEILSEKHRRRILRKTSKGAFFRSLKQAKNNVSRALFTVLLLGYVGVLDTPELLPYVELGSRLKALAEERDSEEIREALVKLIEGSIMELTS